MTTIWGVGAAPPARALRGRAGADLAQPGGFRLADGAAAAGTLGEAGRTAGIDEVSLGGLLAAQEGAAMTVRDRAARRHGQRILDLLRRLQQAALARMPVGEAAVRELADLARAIGPVDDPRLNSVLREIAVRAAVELARRA